GSSGEFFGTPSSRDDPYSEFHKSHIQLGVGLHIIGVQTQLTASSQSTVVGGGHHGDGRIPQTQHGLLKGSYQKINFIPFLLHRVHQYERKVGTHRKLGSLVGDHKALEVLFGKRYGLV